jgi:hypothetical protein
VFAKDFMQIFYAGDNKTKGKLKVVLEEKRKIIDLEGVTDEEDYSGYQEIRPFEANVTLPILEEGDEPVCVRRDNDEALIVGPTINS